MHIFICIYTHWNAFYNFAIMHDMYKYFLAYFHAERIVIVFKLGTHYTIIFRNFFWLRTLRTCLFMTSRKKDISLVSTYGNKVSGRQNDRISMFLHPTEIILSIESTHLSSFKTNVGPFSNCDRKMQTKGPKSELCISEIGASLFILKTPITILSLQHKMLTWPWFPLLNQPLQSRSLYKV